MAQPATTTGTIPTWSLTDRLRKAREHAGFNQTELAEATGIGRSTIVTYETGKSVPPRHILITWAFITGVDVDWLVGDEARPPRQRKGTFTYLKPPTVRPTDTRPKGRPSVRTSPGVRRPTRIPRPVT